MDSFTIAFQTETRLEKLTSVLVELDKGLTITVQDDNTISVAKGLDGNNEEEAHVWIEFYEGDQLSVQLDYHPHDVALRKLGAKTLLNVIVRRNSESSLLAVHIAGIFSKVFGGVISWDGMDYWEALFNRELGSPK